MKKVSVIILIVLGSINISVSQIGGLLNKAKEKAKANVNGAESKKESNTRNNSENSATESTNESPESSNSSTPVRSSKTSDELDKFKAENKPNDGVTTEFHKKNLGKIVFSKEHILESKENSDKITNNFRGSDLIFARCYLDESLYNTPVYGTSNGEIDRNQNCAFWVDIYINGKKPEDMPELTDSDYMLRHKVKEYFGNFKHEDHFINACYTIPNVITSSLWRVEVDPSERIKKTSFELFLNPDKMERAKEIGTDWLLLASALPVGDYNITLKLFGVTADSYGNTMSITKNALAIGEFKFSKGSNDNICYGKDYAKEAPKPGMVNPALEGQIASLINECKYSTKSTGHKALKIVLMSKNWITLRHDISGVIVARTIEAWGVIKDNNGGCKQIHAIVTEDFNGKTYGKPYLRECFVLHTDYPDIDCSTVK